MKCPVCGYESDSDDVECIACGSDMARASASIALEKKRSDEAMERYHQQQRDLRIELGIESADDEKGAPASVGASSATSTRPVSSIEVDETPYMDYSAGFLCPQCGFKNGADVAECIRCGIVFRKLKSESPAMGSQPSHGSPGIEIDPARYGLDASPAPAGGAYVPPPTHQQRPILADLGEEPMNEPVSAYDPYVREVRSDPLRGVKVAAESAGEAWGRVDFKAILSRMASMVQETWSFLRRVKPAWYGIMLAILIGLASIPFAWKGVVMVKGAVTSHLSERQQSRLVAEFKENNGTIRADVRRLSRAKQFEEARAQIRRFDIAPLSGQVGELTRYIEEKELYAKVLSVPSWKFETNYSLFAKLTRLNPSEGLYAKKKEYYKKRLSDRSYDQALRYYKGPRDDAAESLKAVALIDKAVAFYPSNKSYRDLRRKLIAADLLFYRGTHLLQMAIRDEGRGKGSKNNQRKVAVWLRNVGDQEVYINPEFFTLQTKNGKNLKYNDGLATGLDSKLKPGEKTGGVLYFKTLGTPRFVVFDHLSNGMVKREFP